jgi:hypothetical protein
MAGIICVVLAGCLTFFCPCVAFGRIAEIVDQGATCEFILTEQLTPMYLGVSLLMVDRSE